MIKITTAALFFLAAGVFTSVSILSIFQILFTIPLIYYTYLALKNKEVHLPISAWFLIAFAFVALLSLSINYDIIPKPSKNFGRVKYFFFGALGVLVMKAWLRNSSEKMQKFVSNTLFLSLTITGIYSVYSYKISVDGRATGLTETMRYGYGSAMILLTILSALLHKGKIKKWFDWRIALPVFFIAFLGMYLTYTRGALLGFLCGLPFVLYYFNKKIGLTIGALAFVSALGLGGIYLFGSGNYQSRFLQNKNNPSDVIRRSQWQAAIIATKERPVLGWGLSNFHSQLKRIKNDYDLDAKDYNDAHSHNLYLEVSSGTGLIGLFLFLSWLISWAIELFKRGGLTRALVIPFGVAFTISSFFEVTFDANNASMIFFFYSLSSAIGEMQSEASSL